MYNNHTGGCNKINESNNTLQSKVMEPELQNHAIQSEATKNIANNTQIQIARLKNNNNIASQNIKGGKSKRRKNKKRKSKKRKNKRRKSKRRKN